MKPLNLDNKPCSPISSNCVVWQGPDIPCIKLCIGDTVSDVVFAMATELCTILDTLKVTNYDLTCFNINSCGPQDFQALIQFLITQICELQGVAVAPSKEQTCPDCVVSVADCFVTGTQTTMQLVDYVQLIGERVCSLIRDISSINGQITELWSAVIELQNITPGTIPEITAASKCSLGATIVPGQQYPIQVILEAFFDSIWCDFYAITGTTSSLSTAVQRQCISNTDFTLSIPASTYPAAYGLWISNPITVADTITNTWIALCDIYTYIEANQDSWSITVADTNSIDLTLSPTNELTAKIQDTGWRSLLGFDFYSGVMLASGTKPECRRIGNVIHFRGVVYVPLDNGLSTPLELKESTTYNSVVTTGPALSGSGSVSLNGTSILNFNSGTNCIPPEVHVGSLDTTTKYTLPYPTVLVRTINLVGSGSTALSSAVEFGISGTGILGFETIEIKEADASTLGSSPLRYITSNIRGAEIVPNYTSNNSNLHSFPVPTPFDETLGYSIGDVVIYANQLYVAVVNIGTPSPPAVTPNPASTPGNWNLYTYPIQTKGYNASSYPFSCNAGAASNLGGFYTRIDGLIAYVDCTAATATIDCQTP